jgi:hypothetical protein
MASVQAFASGGRILYSSSLAMRNRTAKPEDMELAQRIIVALVGLGFIATGIINMVHGRLHYLTYWRAPVFYPYIVLIGILLLAGAFSHRGKR